MATDEQKDVTNSVKEAKPIALHKGALTPKTGTELSAMISKIAEGGGFPDRFKTPASRIAAYNLSHSLLGDRWQLCLNNIASIRGQMCIYGELPSALAEQTKEVQEKEVFCLDEQFKKICIENKNLLAQPFVGVCIIQRKGRSKKEFTYSVEEARAAGQLPADKSSSWTKWPKVMLMRKAMALAVKFEFADAMVGVPVAEYEHDILPDFDPRDVTPGGDDVANKLNKTYSDQEQAVAQ